jgi:hypothetical protein
VGYAIYGFDCLQSTGSFWTPFQAQSEWGKALSFRPLFLLFPRSLLNDLHGLYFPFILFFLAAILIYVHAQQRKITLYIPEHPLLWLTLFYPPLAILLYSLRSFQLWKRGKLSTHSIPSQLTNLQTSYLFFFCLAVCMANSIISFLTANNYLYSLGRYVFATPFFFIAFGMLVDCLDSSRMRTFLYGCLVISGLGLIHQWHNWGGNLWVG